MDYVLQNKEVEQRVWFIVVFRLKNLKLFFKEFQVPKKGRLGLNRILIVWKFGNKLEITASVIIFFVPSIKICAFAP